jgi:hypothetical protein
MTTVTVTHQRQHQHREGDDCTKKMPVPTWGQSSDPVRPRRSTSLLNWSVTVSMLPPFRWYNGCCYGHRLVLRVRVETMYAFRLLFGVVGDAAACTSVPVSVVGKGLMVLFSTLESEPCSLFLSCSRSLCICI